MVGRALCEELEERGHSVRTLSRSRGDVSWDVPAGTMDAGAMDGVDCVVHLAGEPVAQRWTLARKARILGSRVDSTRLLVKEILQQAQCPDFICASGINYYGYKNCGWVDESGVTGDGFLAEVCRQWEGAAQPLIGASVRTVFVRIGLVLSPEGGALAKMLPTFRSGLGGRIGLGTQAISWIALTDLVSMLCRCVEDTELIGPINAVAPAPVTNAGFTETLGRVLRRPTVCSVPYWLIHLILGEMGRETVLADLEVVPRRMMDAGFVWQFPDLEPALRVLLGHNPFPPGLQTSL